jgi:anti-sigma regulatory factor (Ser/Thr protein kinase)
VTGSRCPEYSVILGALRLADHGGATLGEWIAAEIDNDITETACVTSLVESFGERHALPDTIIFHMKLALDELLTNIISYGFLDGGRHKIIASIGIEGDKLEAEIIDDGIAFNPLARSAPDIGLATEERGVGGLGIHFIRSVMDRVDYHRSDGRNHLKLVKKLRQNR